MLNSTNNISNLIFQSFLNMIWKKENILRLNGINVVMKSAQQALFAYFAMLRNICLEIVLQVIGDNATGLLGNIMVLSIIFRLKIHICHNMLVIECFDTNIFLSFYLFFLILYFFSFEFLFSFSNEEEARDIAVTWHVTWCDVTSLEHDGRV